MTSLNFAIPFISSSEHKSYRLSIRLLEELCLIACIDREANQCVIASTLPLTSLNDFIGSLEARKIDELTIASDAVSFAFVPELLFDANRAGSYLPIEPVQQRRADVRTVQVPKMGVVSVVDARRVPNIHHKTANKTHIAHALSSLIVLSNSYSEPTVVAEWIDKTLLIVATEGNKLLFANSFEARTCDDAAYFLLSVFQQADWDVNEMPIRLCGERDKLTDLKRYMSDYVANIALCEPTQDGCWNPSFDAEHYPLFASLLVDFQEHSHS